MTATNHIENHHVHKIGWLRAAVLGANDGIVSTASLIVGVAAAEADFAAVMLAGTAGLVAGAMSMAAGEYVSVSSQSDTERADLAKEAQALRDTPEAEQQELAQIYQTRGVAPDLAREVAAQLMANDALGAHARDELGISEIVMARPVQAALASAGTFSLGAALPLLAFAVSPLALAIPVVAAASLISLAGLGALAASAGGAGVLRAAGRVTLWGGNGNGGNRCNRGLVWHCGLRQAVATNPGAAMTDFTKTTLTTPTGATLNLLSMQPKTSAKAVVQIHHGMVEHAARYQRFANALAKAGYATYVYDLRGHGQTKAPDAHLGVLAAENGFQALAGDALAVNDHIRALHPGLKVIVFGHSMGSILSLYFALTHPGRIDGLALWNSGVDAGLLVAVSRLILMAEALLRGRNSASKVATTLTFDTWNKVFKPNRTGFDWLSRDEAEVDAYIADPLCGFPASISLWLDLMAAITFGADDSRLAVLPKALPVHLVGGGDDPCSDKGRAMERLAIRLRKAGMVDVDCQILPQTRHESLNETNRDQTTADFIDWLDAKF